MTTSRKPESGRTNGTKSRGPTTPEGKLASRKMPPQRGALSRTVVLECESQQRFEQLLAELKKHIQPRNSVESGFVEMMAIARWRQMRVWAFQNIASKIEMARLGPPDRESANDVAPETPTADPPSVVLLKNLRRYEACYKRQFNHAKDAIQKIRSRQNLFDAPGPHRPLHAPTFKKPRTKEKVILQNEPTASEKSFLQNEPMTRNETCQRACETLQLSIDS
jgi:hypothetical protein